MWTVKVKYRELRIKDKGGDHIFELFSFPIQNKNDFRILDLITDWVPSVTFVKKLLIYPPNYFHRQLRSRRMFSREKCDLIHILSLLFPSFFFARMPIYQQSFTSISIHSIFSSVSPVLLLYSNSSSKPKHSDT